MAFTFASCSPEPEPQQDLVEVESKIELDVTDAFIVLGGDSIKINALVTSDSADRTVTWESSDTTVATVEGGVVTAVGKGKATITAKAVGKSAVCNITVTEQGVKPDPINCTVSITGDVVLETSTVKKGELFTVPANISSKLTREVGDNEAFIITYGEGIQVYPGDMIEITEDTMIKASILPGTEGLQFEFDPVYEDCLTVVESNVGNSTLVIPEKKYGLPVVSISPFALDGAFSSIYLPESLKSIGDGVFYQVGNITQISFPPALQEIGEYAFQSQKLKDVRFNTGLRTIGTGAFLDTSMTSIELPKGIVTIGNSAFAGNSHLRYVSIPSSVESIDKQAFDQCPNLKVIDVAKNREDCISWPETWYGQAEVVVYEDGERQTANISFNGKGISIPSVSVKLGEVFTLPQLPERDGYRLSVKNGDDEILPGVEYLITEDTVLTCSWIKTWTLNVNGEEKVVDDGYLYTIPKSIGDEKVIDVLVNEVAYAGESIVIHSDTIINYDLVPFENYTITAKWTVEGKEESKSFEVREESIFRLPVVNGYYVGHAVDEDGTEYHLGVDIIATKNMTFTYMDILKGSEELVITEEGNVSKYSGKDVELVIPNATADGIEVKTIGFATFQNRDTLRSVYIPDGVINMAYQAFLGCTNLSSVRLPVTLKTIENFGFENCPLNEIELPEGLDKIGEKAFVGNKATSIIIPESVATMGHAVFANASNLETIVVNRTKSDCVSWYPSWHGATEDHPVTVRYSDDVVVYPEK